jgi:hypothetical protein
MCGARVCFGLILLFFYFFHSLPVVNRSKIQETPETHVLEIELQHENEEQDDPNNNEWGVLLPLRHQ